MKIGPWRYGFCRLERQVRPLSEPAAPRDSHYWDQALTEVCRSAPTEAWRAYMRRVYGRLVREWLPAAALSCGLKTDLFEEAVSAQHLLPDLGPGSVGIDCSQAVVHAARTRLAREGGQYKFVVGDLRRLPLRSGSITHILSGSSLDHFSDKADIATSLAELARVLAPEGVLVITFDNPHNPIVWVRNRLPSAWLKRLHLVPFYLGATYGRTEACQQLAAVGLTVTHITAVAHAPRIPFRRLITVAERLGWKSLQTFVARLLDSFEILERWPTRYQTGYYLALRAKR